MNDSDDRWVTGDHHGLAIPADPAALRGGGAAFLTQAFRVSGALDTGNSVERISQFEEVPGGSTGRKLLLGVEYEEPNTHTDLFVKFSRDLENPIRDRGKTQMESEVLFATLSREPGFPITVPTTQFADYHRGTGTGILISERIQFGSNGIERQYHKCLDYEMPEPLEHYRALLTALARVAGGHRSGRIPADQFPVDMQSAQVGERAPISADKLDRRLAQLADFAEISPGLLPANARSPQFISRLRDDAPRFLAHEPAVWSYLADHPDYIALCHWNANVDNAWFWRSPDNPDNALNCGLMDWGCAGQMNVAMALWGAMSGAETDMWDHHLDELLRLFASTISDCGGPELSVNELRNRVMLYVGIMTVAWLLDVPALIRSRFGDAAHTLTRRDPRIKNDESVRAPLQMLTNALNLWETQRFGDALDAALRP